MANIREITSLPLAPSVIDELVKHGFRHVSDLEGMKPLDLSQEVKSLTPEAALHVIQCAQKSGLTADPSLATASHGFAAPSDASSCLQTTAKDLLMKMGIHRPLITFCREIDTMLGGGVLMGQITEFCGVPGIGKTQLAIQLALDVQIPEVFNGNGGEAVYIDTEGSFLPERAAEMAAELSLHLQKLSKMTGRRQDIALGQLAAAENMTMERFLEGINVFRCHDQSELLSTIHHLGAFLKNKTRIKCVIIDSIAFHFRADLQDIGTRNRVLAQVAQTLNALAHEHKLAVVLVNHVTTKIAQDEDGKRLVPALGEQWAHCITNRVILYWQQVAGVNQRFASLLKSPAMPPKTVQFAVLGKGIRDVPPPAVSQPGQSMQQQAAQGQAQQRQPMGQMSSADLQRKRKAPGT